MYEITTKELEPQPVLIGRRRVGRSEIAAAISELLPRVFEHAQREDIPIAGPPFARYKDMSAGTMTIEPGMPVTLPEGAAEPSGPGPADDPGEVIMDVLPGGLVATTLHIGNYDGLRQAYEALEAWMEAEGYASRDAPWESYLTDPGQNPDPATWRTQVVWPVRRTG